MTRIRYAKDVSALLRGTETLLICAPQGAFHEGAFLQDLPEEIMRRALRLAAGTRSGDLGATARTLCDEGPKQLAIGVLPDRVSRYNAPSRAESIRRVVAEVELDGTKPASILILVDSGEQTLPAVNAVARALSLYTARSDAKPATKPVTVLVIDRDGNALAVDTRAKATADASREAARLVDTPPSEMNPKRFQAEAYKLVGTGDGLTKRALVGDALLKNGLGGIHAVGRTALEAPRLVLLSYTPKKRSKLHVALVGKGVTYDTGGLSLKISGNMVGMKADMGGAAAVLGAFRTLAASKARCKVTAVVCLAENAIGPAAVKPDDVITMHSGHTVEINNTDAEGRLLLGDGVSYAARKLKADVILDAATLTGAQGIATGNLHAGLVSNDAELEDVMTASGRACGDLVHPLPFAPEFYQSEFASKVADMRNSVANRANAQVSCAAQFIHAHLDDLDVKWAHVDLAFPAFQRDRGTGFGVALLSEAVWRLA